MSATQRFRRDSDGSAAASLPRRELLQPLLEKADFRRVVDPPALEEAHDHGLGGLELVYVLEDEDLHLLCPRRDVRVGGVALDRARVAQRERQVVEAMLRQERGWGEPGAAPVRIVEERGGHLL